MTIFKTKKTNGYYHRTHRSIKNRKAFKKDRFRVKFYKIKKENIKLYGKHKRKTQDGF